MKNKQNLDLTKFEILVETANGSLIGGFSGALEGLGSANLTDVNIGKCSTTNTNCAGGNCVAGCGASTISA